MTTIYKAELRIRKLHFEELGNSQESARAAMIEGLRRHGVQNRCAREWWSEFADAFIVTRFALNAPALCNREEINGRNGWSRIVGGPKLVADDRANDLARRILLCWRNWHDHMRDDPMETLAHEAAALIAEGRVPDNLQFSLTALARCYGEEGDWEGFTLDEIIIAAMSLLIAALGLPDARHLGASESSTRVTSSGSVY